MPSGVILANYVGNQGVLGLEYGRGATYMTKETPGKNFMIPNKVTKLFNNTLFKGQFLTFMVPI